MKYCVPYFKYFKYVKEVDEIIIPFNDSLDIIKRFIEEKEIQSRIISHKCNFKVNICISFRRLKFKISDSG